MSNTWIARDAQYQLVFMCIPIIAETIHATADDEWNTTLWEGLPVLSSSSSCFATGKANSLSHPTSVVCVCCWLWISLFQMPNRRGKNCPDQTGSSSVWLVAVPILPKAQRSHECHPASSPSSAGILRINVQR